MLTAWAQLNQSVCVVEKHFYCLEALTIKVQIKLTKAAMSKDYIKPSFKL